jgi:hypothetical protein
MSSTIDIMQSFYAPFQKDRHKKRHSVKPQKQILKCHPLCIIIIILYYSMSDRISTLHSFNSVIQITCNVPAM